MSNQINIKNMSNSSLAALVVAAIIVYIGVVLLFALVFNYAFHRFGADWSDFWGWAAIFAISPILRVWVSGRAN